MPYLNIDDHMDENPKVDMLSDAAFRLYMAAMLYCARQGTDGHIPPGRLTRLTTSATKTTVEELVSTGLIHLGGHGCGTDTCLRGMAGMGHVIHDYLQWNHSAAWWKEKRAADTERIRKWREKRGLNDEQDE